MKYRFESIKFENNKIKINGFAVGGHPEDKLIYSYLVNKKPAELECIQLVRNDVSNKYFRKFI